MKPSFHCAACVAALGTAWAGAAQAGPVSATTPGMATATVAAPIVLTHVTGSALNFGSFTINTAGSIVVTAGGVGSTTGDIGLVPGGTPITADKFALTGDASRNFAISTTSGAMTNGVLIVPFTTLASASAAMTSAAGKYAFSVGGTLNLAGTETPGIYFGTYIATVAYN